MLFFLLICFLTIRNVLGLRCWTCDADSHLECFIYGYERDCPGRQVNFFDQFFVQGSKE